MESNSINPSNGVPDLLLELPQRVKSLETKPAGEIVIRDKITTTDPITGVETVFGTLPDGTVGIKEWINDVTPPEKPSTPVVTSATGIFNIAWDGLDSLGLDQPADYFRTVVQISTDGISGWADKDFLRGKGVSTVNGEPYAEIRYFRLISYDQNGNASIPSNSASLINTSSFDDSGLQTRLDQVQAKADAADAKAILADTNAGNAQLDADAAAQAALDAANLAGTKGKTIFSATTPVVADRNSVNLWIDTSLVGGVPGNIPKRWDGSNWVVVTDKTASDAAAVASAAQTTATNANNAAIAASGLASSKSKVIYSTTAPTGADASVNTLWIDTTANANTPKKWVSGTTWAAITDKTATDAAAAAAAANAAIATKITTFYGTTANATVVGDLWIDTTLIGGVPGNVLKRWSGTAWVIVTDKKLQDALTAAGNAQATADGKIKTYAQITAPTGLLAGDVGDIWIDTDDGNKMYRWSSTAWVVVQDTSIADAASLADLANQNALDAANIAGSKGKVLIQSATPGPADSNAVTLWIDTTGGANTPKKWVSGTTWTEVTDKAAKDAAAAAAAAQSKADQAFVNAAAAMTAAGNAQTSANGKNNVYYLAALPSGTGFVVGDTTFIRSAVGQPITAQYQWDGSAWKSVTVGHQVLASIDLGKATIGELDGVYIKARSISAATLLIGSLDNLIAEPDFSGNLVSWGGPQPPAITVDQTGSRNGKTALKFVNSASDMSVYNQVPGFSVEAGSVYRVTAWIKADVAIPANSVNLTFRNVDTANVSSFVTAVNAPAIAANTWTKFTGTYEIPTGIVTTALGIVATAALSTGNLWVDSIACVRAADGALIVDGSIDGKVITGATFQTTATPNRGITLDDTGFSAYDTAGLRTFNIDAATGTISMTGTLNTESVEDIVGTDIYTTKAKFGTFQYASQNAITTAPGVQFNTVLPGYLDATASIFFARDDLTIANYNVEQATPELNTGGSSIVIGRSRGISASAYYIGPASDNTYLFAGGNSWIYAGNAGTDNTMASTYFNDASSGLSSRYLTAYAQTATEYETGVQTYKSAPAGMPIPSGIPGSTYLYHRDPQWPYSGSLVGVSGAGFFMGVVGQGGSPLLSFYGQNDDIYMNSTNGSIYMSRTVFTEINVPNPTFDDNAVNKRYVDTALGNADWIRLPNLGAWVDYVGGGGYRSGIFVRKFGDNVQITGMVKNGSGQMAVIPATHAPAFSAMYPAIAVGAAAGIVVNHNTDGTATISYLYGPATPSYVNITLTIPLS